MITCSLYYNLLSKYLLQISANIKIQVNLNGISFVKINNTQAQAKKLSTKRLQK